MKLNALLSGVLLATAFTTASALSVVSGNVPQDDSNLVRNPCGLPAGSATGLLVRGCLNDDHSVNVFLASDEELSISGGQATLTATDGSLSMLSIAMAGMDTLILNIDANADGFVTFTDGIQTSAPFALDDAGENFFTITGIDSNFVRFETTVNGVETDIVDEVRQIRLGGQAVSPVPEPETYALMMAGLVALGFISRRRKTRK